MRVLPTARRTFAAQQFRDACPLKPDQRRTLVDGTCSKDVSRLRNYGLGGQQLAAKMLKPVGCCLR